MAKKKKKSEIEEYLDDFILEKDNLLSEIDLLLKELKRNNLDKEEIVNEIIKETKYINDLVSMVIKNKDNEDKLMEALEFFVDEYDGRINKIYDLIYEEISKINYLEGS